MKVWKLTGILATLGIVLSIPLYLSQVKTREPAAAEPVATFVGSARCEACHQQAYQRWLDSHHDRAMDVATEHTVLGDFDNVVFEIHGVRSRFYRQGEKFFVHTLGPGGEMGDFEITHTFGVYPLQQYLVPFPGGRLQALPIAWDVKQQRWYHLYPDVALDPEDWLYWTNAGQNWNGMCAECHTTDFHKAYDVKSDTYATRWSEIHVGCEACHGPGSRHVAWAELPDMARPAASTDPLLVKTSEMTARQQVELCAPCHSRRSSLGDRAHPSADLMDDLIPQLLSEGMYFADGQILEEVYVYGSFVQSKMYARDVRCSDCHDVHSLKRLKDGNALCLQCHRADTYDTKAHHFHQKPGESGEPIRSPDGKISFEVGSGAQCEQCHMPGRHYMGIDYRPDHSFRVPRPDLSLTIGTPNACNRCHAEKSAEWATEYFTKWYGEKSKPHYGTVLAAGREASPEAREDLDRLAGDRLAATLVRATALSLLSAYPGPESIQAFERALADEEALMRHTAAANLPSLDPERRIRDLAPLLYDPVKAVRVEAARALAGVPASLMNASQREKQQAVLDEYRHSMAYTGDFAASRHNLGNLDASLGALESAVDNYRAAIRIDEQFYPAKANLATVYNRLGRNREAETLLREVVRAHPGLHEMEYSLGLLLAEMKQYEEAARYLSKAAAGLPQRARVHYNHGALLRYLGREEDAETSLRRALALEPENSDYRQALAELYVSQGRLEDARDVAGGKLPITPQ